VAAVGSIPVRSARPFVPRLFLVSSVTSCMVFVVRAGALASYRPSEAQRRAATRPSRRQWRRMVVGGDHPAD
jgi:hypothetical protein